MRACVLANQVGCPLILSSLTSSTASDIVKKRKSKGCVVAAEVTAASLACDGSNYWNKCWRHAAGFVTSPPLREGEEDSLLDAAVDGTVDVVSPCGIQHSTEGTGEGQLHEHPQWYNWGGGEASCSLAEGSTSWENVKIKIC